MLSRTFSKNNMLHSAKYVNILALLYQFAFSIIVPVQSTSSTVTPRIESGLYCKNLLIGQFLCDSPFINSETQQADGCSEKTRTVKVPCRPAPNIKCIPDGESQIKQFNGSQIGFWYDEPCKWTNGYNFETALLLSIFLGMFGIDRFYLGYPAIGLVKFATLGFFFIGQLLDIMLIALQIVKPSDGSEYVIDYYGAGLNRIVKDDNTYIIPQDFT